MVNYQTITALVNQIPAGTWDVLREIKELRPAIMLSELIECRRRTSQEQEAPEPRSQTERLADTVQGDEGPAQVVRLGHRGTPSVTCSDEVAISSPPAP